MRPDDTERSVWVAIDPADVPHLQELLAEENPFVSDGITTSHPYRLTDYVLHGRKGGIPICALLDRNLVSRAVALARGESFDHTLEEASAVRVAAACMAFLVAADILLEPNISLYELAESLDSSHAQDQLGWLRVADHIHPQAYLDVALRRASALPSDLALQAEALSPAGRAADSPVDFDMPLTYWRRHRCSLTRIALLDRSDASGVEKYRRLLEWSVESGFFDGLALSFACVLFGHARLGRMMKGVRSRSFARCLDGIRNTAWDLTYVSYWRRRVNDDEGKRLWLFCTNDKACAQVARAALDPARTVEDLFADNWRPAEARSLHAEYLTAERHSRDPGRERVLRDRFDRIDEIRSEMENDLALEVEAGGAG